MPDSNTLEFNESRTLDLDKDCYKLGGLKYVKLCHGEYGRTRPWSLEISRLPERDHVTIQVSWYNDARYVYSFDLDGTFDVSKLKAELDKVMHRIQIRLGEETAWYMENTFLSIRSALECVFEVFEPNAVTLRLNDILYCHCIDALTICLAGNSKISEILATFECQDSKLLAEVDVECSSLPFLPGPAEIINRREERNIYINHALCQLKEYLTSQFSPTLAKELINAVEQTRASNSWRVFTEHVFDEEFLVCCG